MATKERRKFTPEFKREAVRLTEQPGRSLAAVARELGVERSVLKAWVDNFAAGRYEKDRSLPLKAAQQMERGTIVTLLPDGGWKYLSSGAWTDPIDEVVERATRINYW